MVESYKTIFREGQGEIVEKKSRFIATICHVESEEEAVAFIEAMKKKYWDARHNCSAFVIGKKAELQRCSDDGEPGGTAGRPMLDVLLGQEIRNAVVVVTRYFGGTLLGTGGLVRAYTQAVQSGIANAVVIEKKHGIRLHITTDYNGVGKIQYILGQAGIAILDSDYGVDVTFTALVPDSELESLKKELIEATNGKAGLVEGDVLYFGKADGELQLFED